jgi:serine/threonine-protein kinase
MEYHEMNLHDKIKQKKEQSSKFTNEELYKHIRKLLLSFKIMEESKIYHRDIKPKNMLYTNTNEIKIIDFSASDMKITDQRSSEMTKNNTVTGTATFMAPEIQEAYIKGEKKFRGWREKADVFSLGMTIFQMIYLGNLNTYNLRENNQKLMDLVDQEVKDNRIT